MGKLIALAAAVASLAATTPASAELLNYSLTGSGITATFSIDTSWTPDDWSSGLGLTYWDVSGTYLGNGIDTDLADISFYNSAIGGGTSVFDFWVAGEYLVITDGPQLYSGPESAPTLLTGTFQLTEYEGPGTYTLTVTGASSPGVPEPATWAMLIAGFGMAGAALRSRRSSHSFA